MINLLPPKEKEEFILKQNKKLIAVFGAAFLIAILCLILVLLSVRFYIMGEVASQKFILDQAEKRYQTKDFVIYKDLLNSYNNNIAQIKSFYKNKTQFTTALKNILDVARPEGVFFTNISMIQGENGKITVKTSGFSSAREGLISFKKNLENSDKIKNPGFSPESWINSKNINFYLTLETNGN